MVRSFLLLQVPVLGLLACSAGDPAAPPPASLDPDVEEPPQLGAVNCDSPQKGCPCADVGASIECGTVSERRGDYVICSMGTRSCSDGTWGECVGSDTLVQGTSTSTSSLRLQALSAGQDCKNLCDPECVSVLDSPDGLVVDDDLVASPGGLTLPGGTWGGSCADLSVSPNNSTITVTSITSNGAVTTVPPSLTLSGSCAGGVGVQPSWSIDSYDRAVIDSQGALSVFSAVGSPILVTATSSADTATALVNVRVNIQDRGTNTAVATALDGAGIADTGTPSKTLYPYRNTVFPLDLKAPLVQWEQGSTAATAVKVALRYQVVGESTPRFWWSRIYNTEPKDGTLVNTAPAWQIPQEIWSAFDRSAAGASTGAEIIIQRYYASAARTAMRIPVRFATAALNGTVYYTQYLRTLTGAGCNTAGMSAISSSYAVGNICPVGMCTMSSSAGAATTRAIDLSSPTSLNKDPFNGTAGCPVCHSVSASGTRYISVNQAASSSGSGVSSIGLDASGNAVFSALSTAPNYSVPTGTSQPDSNGEEAYGFSFGALVPDGSQVLQGSAYWGNTIDTPASNNVQDAAMKGVTGNVKPYFFANTSKPGAGVQFATTAALPVNTRSSNVLTGTVMAALNIDGVNVAAGNSVLVKNELTSAHNGIYTVTAAGSGSAQWRLTRRNDADATGDITGGMEVRVTDGNANRTKTFYVTTPASGSAAINSASIVFSEKVRPAIIYTAAPLVAKYATAAALAPATVVFAAASNTLTAGGNGLLTVDGQLVANGEVVLVKDQANTVHNGLYTVTNPGAVAAKWVLTRHGSFDTAPSATNDVKPGLEVRVTHGSSNAGKVFYVATPLTGAVSVNTHGITFRQTELPAMMVPTISPDGSKVVYVNGDADPHPVPLSGTAYDTGWRRGLSMFSYNQATNTISSKKRLLNTWSSGTAGTPIKWPFFEPDSRSLLYVQTHANEYCSSNADLGRCATVSGETFANTTCTADASTNVNTNLERACYQGSRGSMTPTTRGFWPGRIFSLDSSASNVAGTVAELARLNNGDDDGGADDTTDGGKSYQPTVLPFSVGGYRWVIFTSPRPYGHQFNMKGTHFSCGASMLWVAALTDVASSGADRSHPAFFLPGQNVGRITNANHYINERGYLVPSLCKPAGASCGTNDDCCGGSGSSPTAACRAPAGWTPAAGPPAKTCATLSGTCSNAGGSCGSPADCCNGAACVDFRCEAPPTFEPADFTRDYEADCPDSYQPEWQLLSFYLTTEGDSSLDFSIQTANTAAGLSTAVVRHLGESTNDIVTPATPDFFSVKGLLDPVKQNGLNHLRMTIVFNPSTNGLHAPVLHDWEMKYTCVPAQ